MPVKHARVATLNAKRYIPRLCRHFSHKVSATWSETTGKVEFPVGICQMEASTEALVLRCESGSNEDLERACGIVGTHLVRFAARARDGEELEVIWEST